MASQSTAIFDRDRLASVPRLFWVGEGDARHLGRGKRLLQLLMVLVAVGLVAAGIAAAEGHHVLGTTSEISWGVLIATYVFFAVSASGLCLVSSLGHVFGVPMFEPLAKRALFLAIAMLLIGFGVIATELERPLLLARLVLLSPNPSAPIWWMGTLYGIYVVVIAAELYFLVKGDHARARTAGIVSIFTAVAATSTLGSVFGLLHGRPFWYGPFVPVYFLTTAFVCGAALLILIVYFTDYFTNDRQVRPENLPVLRGLGKLLALFLGILLFVTAWRLIAGVYGGHTHEYEVTMAMLTGPLFMSFWFFEILLSIVVPMTVLLSPKRTEPRFIALAAILPMVGVFVMRFNFVYAGQMFSLKPVVGHLGEILHYGPPFKGNVAGFLPYTPSLVEALIVTGAIAAAIVVYVVGARAFRLTEER